MTILSRFGIGLEKVAHISLTRYIQSNKCHAGVKKIIKDTTGLGTKVTFFNVCTSEARDSEKIQSNARRTSILSLLIKSQLY